MNGRQYGRIKLQFRQYSIDPDFPIFSFTRVNAPTTAMMALNDGEQIRYMHFHNCIEILFCCCGTGRLYVEDEEMEFGPGDVVLVQPYSAHISRPVSDDNYCEYLYFDPDMLLHKFYPDSLPCAGLFNNSLANINCVIGADEYPAITRRVAEILEELSKQQLNYRDCVKGLVLALMMELTRAISAQKPRERRSGNIVAIFPAIKYINDNYSERIHAENLHELCFLSATHFRRMFGAVMGCSPLEYIHRMRINRACDLLLSTNDSILNISLAVGFDSVSSFNRQFIQATGIAPSKWRREHVQARSELMPTAPYDASCHGKYKG